MEIDLRQLLDVSELDAFFNTVWERQPRLVRKAIARTRAQILTLADFEALMVSAMAETAAGVSVVEGFLARPVVGGTAESRLLAVYDAYYRRCTLLQAGLQRRWPSLATLCRQVENALISHGLSLAEGVGANAYLTPAEAQGFDIHYDNHCALILQLRGSKTWTVFPPVDGLPIVRCARPIRRDELQSPLLQPQLVAGDVMYIPRGFPHCASTEGESSLHVTLSMRPVIWAEAISTLCESDDAFRRSVVRKADSSSDTQVHFAGELLPRLARMDVSGVLERRWSEIPARLFPLTDGSLRAIDAGRTLGLNTMVRRRADSVCSVSVEGSDVVLRLPGTTLRLPIEMRAIVEFVAQNAEFTPKMLPGTVSGDDRIRLVRNLIKRCVVEPVEDGRHAVAPELEAIGEAT